tara:strand:- start:60870 stop:61490 length:621 start_codon:yes stop_codon:yes gene_type:complete
MNELTNIYKNSSSPQEYAKKYFKHLVNIMDRIDTNSIGEVIDLILDTRNKGKSIYFIGNGGSAATASHFANDLSIGTRTSGLKPFKAISLTDNMAVITAIGNDNGYEEIFLRQLEVAIQPGDIVVAISASGNSPNLIKAINFAKERKNKVVGLTGFDGGELKKLSDFNIHIPTDKGEYGPVEDFHMILDHLFGTYLNQVVLDERRV